ncbi:unnamed protein product [Polarella glacialis]|uniref:catechol O-methyltransferase n=1 Tax=Polarella glacialis TaxID=89957 RepID=A0A813HBF4_POLGL|nr:unnamed protein product [Polarella glacialis]CAE8678042.1 unnamed protein product [Polarella glacialis]
MGRLPDFYERGNYGDGREEYALKSVLEQAPAGDAAAAIRALDAFHVRWTLLNVGPDKGRTLDEAAQLAAALSRFRSGRQTVNFLEVGSYIGYSALRIGLVLKQLANAADLSQTDETRFHLTSLERNAENAAVAEKIIAHAGLSQFASVRCVASVEAFLGELSSEERGEEDASPFFSFVFLDHQKSCYLRDLLLLESANAVGPLTVVAADNVAGRLHLENREQAIARGKRKKPCGCVNKGCNFLQHVRNSGRYAVCETVCSEATGDAIEVVVGRCAEFSGSSMSDSTTLDLSGLRLNDSSLLFRCCDKLPLPALPDVRNVDLSRNLLKLDLGGVARFLRRLRGPVASVDLRRNVLRAAALGVEKGADEAAWSPGLALLIEELLLSSDAGEDSGVAPVVDLRFNERCGAAWLVQRARDCEDVQMLLSPWGQLVGARPSDRDASFLRAQLEPLPSRALSERLATLFGCSVDPDCEREELMGQLLRRYAATGRRRTVAAPADYGHAVGEARLKELLRLMRAWVGGRHGGTHERPSVQAEHYMILKRPEGDEGPQGPQTLSTLLAAASAGPTEAATKAAVADGSWKTRRARAKLVKHFELWDCACGVLKDADPAFFANQFTQLAVTHNFRGSPHIDKQNTGPFYAVSVGDFSGGEICIERDAETVVCVATRHRLCQLDGRHVHWVNEWRGEAESGAAAVAERFSLIFYPTAGAFQPPGPALCGGAVPVSSIDAVSRSCE